MKLFRVLPIILASLCISCLSIEEKKKKAEEEGNAVVAIKSKLIKGAGEALKSDGKDAATSATEGIGEVIKGITAGFDKSINQAKVLPDSTFSQTFEIGRTEKFFNDSTKVKKVSVYLIANKEFDGKVKLKAFDTSKKEIGRSVVKIEAEEDSAEFFNFEFDNRTPLMQADYFTIESKK